jgi:ferric-dicitrate binding protein FerR (iron transport regulator)
MNENNERDELFRNRIKTALHQLNGQPNGFDSDASIEAELASIEAEPLDDHEFNRIMNQVQRSILEAARSRAGVDVMQNRTTRTVKADVANHSDDSYRQRRPQNGSAAILAIVTTSLCLLTAFGLFQVTHETAPEDKRLTSGAQLTYELDPLKRSSHHFRYVAQPRPQAAAPEQLTVGQTIRTAARERRRVLLPDGSILYLNEQSTVALTANRTVALYRGQLFVEVTPASLSGQKPFVVETPDRSVTALGTKFAVSADKNETEVLVTQGKVRVSGAPNVITGGQVAAAEGRQSEVTIDAAPRASQALSWTRDLIASAEPSLVPGSEYRGGSLLVVDPSGQEMKLSLRKFHVDAHIEDGFARTTIDQTYFNHTHSRQEGTFKFPLPPDASLSRLAMYVNGKLMEGGMVERDHGRNVFEQIMHTKRDPALLEWVDGSTFKMRVFPLEPRQEKRIVLSYTQRLPNDYNRTEYRFPAGHSLDRVRDWSTRLTIANGAGRTRWFSPTHLLKATEDDDNLVLEGNLHNAVLDKDLVVELTDAATKDADLSRPIAESVAFSGAQHEGYSYQMLRFRPNLNGKLDRPRRNWVFLYESSGDRNPLLARVQLDVVSTILEHGEHDDTFSIISAATRSEAFRIKPIRCSKRNIAKAIGWLEKTHLVGALDLEKALAAAKPFCKSNNDTILVHVGSAHPVIGERDEKKLLKCLPSDAQYVGVGVGKRWSRSFMKSAAGRSGGYFTQINPDEKVGWRAFELLSTLNAPRLINLKVDSGRKDVRFLTFTDTISHGQEFAAITRLSLNAKPFTEVTVTGTLDGQPFRRTLPVTGVSPQANYLPRTWARLEIDRLVANSSAANKDAIVKLSKAMYVMSPFTSLLVLEDEAMYKQFNVDRGRKDHWALYPAPATIQVVHEPGPTLPETGDPVDRLRQQLKAQTARVDTANANLGLAQRDQRTRDELAKLHELVAREEHGKEMITNRLKLAELASHRASASVADTVLFRHPPSVSVPASYVYQNTRRRRFANSLWDSNQSRFGRRSGIAPSGESGFQNYWDFRPNVSPGGIELFNFWTTETDVDDSLFGNRNISHLNDFHAHWGTFQFGTDGKDFGDEFIADRIRGYEMAYRMESRNEGFGTPLPAGFIPRGGTVRDNKFFMNDQKFLNLYGRGVSSFDADLNGNGLVDNVFLGVRPRILFSEESVLIDPEFLPSINTPLRTRLERDESGTVVRLARPASSSSLRYTNPNWFEDSNGDSSVWVDSALPHFDYRFVDQDLDGILLDDSLSFASEFIDGRIHRSSIQMPVSSFASDFIEDRRNDVERYGRVPILDGYNVNLSDDVSARFYVSINAPNVSRDQILRFRTTEQGQRIVRGFQHLSGPHRVGIPGQVRGGSTRPHDQGVQISIQSHGVLQNILNYAPGMQTSTADLLAVIDAESKPSRQLAHGTIDEAARRLVDKARSLGWEEVAITVKENSSGTKFLCNGAGHLRLERRTVDGLLEQVTSDGETLLHLYPEFGIGARRSVTRFHRRSLSSMAPWLLPPVEDLVIGCDIRQVNDTTIRITRIQPAPVDGDTKAPTTKAGFELTIELVFDDSGRLSERRLIKLSTSPELSEQIICRHVYESTGGIRIVDKADQVLSEVKFQRKPVARPSDAPSTDPLVILPLPYRSADSYSLTLPAQPAGNGSVDYSQISETDAMKLVATHVANSDYDALWNVINQRFVSKDDCRMGFAVLLSAASSTNNSQPIHEVASHNQGSSALGSFLVQHFEWWRDQDRNKEFGLPDSASPFIRHLADIHNLYTLWSSGRATQDRTKSQVNQELSRALELIRKCPSKRIAWALLNVVQQSIDEKVSTKQLQQRLATEAASFENVPGFFGTARYARVLWLISAGKTDEARSLYSRYRLDAIAAGITPAVSDELRTAFKAAAGTSESWSQVILDSSEPLIEQQRSLELLQLALNCAVIAEHDTARQLLDRGIKGVKLSKRPDLLIVGLQCLITIDDWSRAEEFTRHLMNFRNAHENAALWRTASQIAAALGDDDESLRRLEQAMRLEFSVLPDTVNVASLRGEYNKLFDRFTSYSQMMLEAGKPLPDDFVNRLTQAADAWRSIDPDSTAACQRTARLLQLIGLYDDAWDYWTTPLVNTASSSDAWENLAVALTETKQLHRAILAWNEAFAAEPTDPELLWKHATLLRDNGQPEQAKKLLTKIINGKWQPRFAHFKSKAKSLLQKL